MGDVVPQKRKRSDSSGEVPGDSKRKSQVGGGSSAADESDDCQILERSIPLIIVDSDDTIVLETTTPDETSESSADWVWVEKSCVSDMPSETEDAIVTGAEVDELLPSKVENGLVKSCPTPPPQPLLQLQFRDKTVFAELKNTIHQAIRDTLFKHQRNVQIDERPDDFRLIVTETMEDDLCVFMVDANPATDAVNMKPNQKDIPKYSLNVAKVFDHTTPTVPETEDEDKCQRSVRRPKNQCFNCDGDHTLRDCTEPKNQQKIRDSRNQFGSQRTERYHVDANQQFGHFTAGVLSQPLRQALGLREQDVPLHVYRMRVVGYPPGWLEEAKVSRSGLELFDERVSAEFHVHVWNSVLNLTNWLFAGP